MELEFTKMHGAGNDFVFLDCLKQNIDNLESIAKKLCDRRFGIGADQLLTVHPSKVADFKMEIYNADGSQVEMCGNGIRCFAKYVYDHGITQKRELEVETLAGIIRPGSSVIWSKSTWASRSSKVAKFPWMPTARSRIGH